MHILLSVFIALCLTLTGCSSNIVKPTEFSGYLANYAQLNEATGVDGEKTLRWKSGDFTPENYHQVLIKDAVFHPKPQVSKQVTTETLDELVRYSSKKLQTEAAKRQLLASKAGKGIVSIRTAITGVKISPEALHPLEIIPFKLVLASAGAAIGFRDHDLMVYYEIVGEDSLSHKPLFTVVRKIKGDTLDSKWDKMEVKDMHNIINQLSEQGMAALAKALTPTHAQ